MSVGGLIYLRVCVKAEIQIRTFNAVAEEMIFLTKTHIDIKYRHCQKKRTTTAAISETMTKFGAFLSKTKQISISLSGVGSKLSNQETKSLKTRKTEMKSRSNRLFYFAKMHEKKIKKELERTNLPL